MTSDYLSSLGGILVSVLLAYIPGLQALFQKLDRVQKRLVFALAMLVVAVVCVLLSCYDIMPVIVCDKPGLVGIATAWLSALIASQTMYKLVIEK